MNRNITSKVPGIKSRHAIVTPTCRENRGDTGAFYAAVDLLRAEYEATLNFKVNENVKFHLVLTVDRNISDNENELKKKNAISLDLENSLRMEYARPTLEGGVNVLETVLSNSYPNIISEDNSASTVDEDSMLSILKTICTRNDRPDFGRFLMQCFRRLSYAPGTEKWRASVIRGALKLDYVESRDVAIDLAADWAHTYDSELILHELRAHDESYDWLKKYIDGIIEEIEQHKYDG